MKENLIKLLNTMAMVETRGENTKIMAQCLQYVENLVQELNAAEIAAKEDAPKSNATEAHN